MYGYHGVPSLGEQRHYLIGDKIMALPSLATPKFDLTLPSSGKVVKIRPFLVKEQKLVLHAIEMNDPNQLNNALDDVLKSCTFGELDIDELPVYDVEYLIMQIRARSVGDVVEINYVCKNHVTDKLMNAEQIKYNPDAKEIRGEGECETRIPLKINIAGLECSSKGERPDNRIMFTDEIGVVMRDLPYGAYKQLSKDTTTSEASLKAIAACIDMVINGEEIFSRGDFTEEEMVAWLEELVGDDFDKLDEYIKSMPTMHVTMPLVCPSCGAKETVELEGLDDFLV